MENYAFYLLLIAVGVGLFFVVRRRPDWGWLVWTTYAVLAVVMAGFLWGVSEPQAFLSDFHKAYYNAGRLVHEDPSSLYDEEPAAFVNVPIVGFLFTPFSELPRKVAAGIATLLGLGVIALAYALLVALAQLTFQRAMLLAGLFVINGPLMNSVREGNATHFVLGALVGALCCVRWNFPVVGGVLLAFCIVMKPPLAMLVLALLLYRKWKTLGALIASLGVVAVASLAIFGWDLHVTWYERIVEPFQQHPLGAFNVQSADGFLARLFVGGDHLTDWTAIQDISSAFAPIRTLVVLLLLGSAAVVWLVSRRATGSDMFALDFATLLVLSVVVGPITWSHYYALMLIPFALILGGQIPFGESRPWLVYMGIAILLVSLPVIQIADPPLGEFVPRFVISHYFYGGVLILGAMLTTRLRLARMAVPDAGVRSDETQRDRSRGVAPQPS